MVLTANNKNATKLLKLILLDAKIRASAGMKNKTPQNIYNTFWNTSVICWWVTTLGTSMVWSSICCFLPTFMKVLLKKVQQRINYFWAVFEILVFQKLGSMAVSSKQILSPSPQQIHATTYCLNMALQVFLLNIWRQQTIFSQKKREKAFVPRVFFFITRL